MYDSNKAKVCLGIGLAGALFHYGSAFYAHEERIYQENHQKVMMLAEQRQAEILQQYANEAAQQKIDEGSHPCSIMHRTMKLIVITPTGTDIGTIRKGHFFCKPSGMPWTLVPVKDMK